MKSNKSLVYRPKALIPGERIEAGLTGFYAAVPDRKFQNKPFKIIYAHESIDQNGQSIMRVYEREIENWNKAERYRRFMDKWGRGAYTLGYFKVCDEL